MRYKWFWLSLSLWVLLGACFPLEALIEGLWAPRWSAVEKFNGDLNGFTVENKIELSPGPLGSAWATTTQDWKSAGWVSLSGSLNLLPIALGLSQDDPRLSEYLHLGLFERQGLYRLLGFWGVPTRNQTYRWTAEIPKAAFSPDTQPTRWNFPIALPTGSQEILSAGAEGMTAASWVCPHQTGEFFLADCASQGFKGKRAWKSTGGQVFLLRRGSSRIAAVLREDKTETIVTAVCY